MMEQPLSKEAAITQMTLLLSPIDLIALDVIWRILMRVFMLYKLVARFMKGYIQPKSVLLKNKARENMDLNLRILDAAIKNLEMKVEKVTQAILKNEDNTVNKVKVKMEKVKKVRKMPEYVKYVKDVFSSKEPTNEEDASNGNAGIKECVMQVKATNGDSTIRKDYILLPMWPADPLFSQNSKESPDAGFKTSGEEEKKDAKDPVNESGNPTEGKDSKVPSTEEPRINQEKDDYINSTNNINTASDGNNTNNVNAASSTINAADTEVNAFNPKTSIKLSKDPIMLELEDIFISDEG
ncbi:hypothetical protein Tco_0259702 [Tanacetum coccineum]